ncbi:MAG: hypothetical protein H0A76_05840 [Candidatus Thiodubiliella endoseptemdiera]|uniref:Uncharacterized protein n=1 Tax=Candidatus Thiodubiliella endoseptemdiera TaxID=2738886 RepID=A0A853F5D5_9GAMM|nr:hypothetical protein [Candidatus Thiodubiliella endoseptemdiera]
MDTDLIWVVSEFYGTIKNTTSKYRYYFLTPLMKQKLEYDNPFNGIDVGILPNQPQIYLMAMVI